MSSVLYVVWVKEELSADDMVVNTVFNLSDLISQAQVEVGSELVTIFSIKLSTWLILLKHFTADHWQWNDDEKIRHLS